ncbi:MAG: dTMP kinase [Clostridia bacterium]|nr:dTMP kinase [Clostridia bacterium]
MRGKFITFEGCEGSGKSTQLKLLADYLKGLGVDFVMTREPGGSEISEEIRKIILNKDYDKMCDECEALLYAAARIQHLREKVAPALDSGTLVICDRYVDSSLAYQGYARGLGAEYVAAINEFALNEFCPDLTVFLDISPAAAFERKHGADENDRMETQGLAFHEEVYKGYKKLTGKFPRICAVDCGGSRLETHEKIKKLLKDKGII